MKDLVIVGIVISLLIFVVSSIVALIMYFIGGYDLEWYTVISISTGTGLVSSLILLLFSK